LAADYVGRKEPLYKALHEQDLEKFTERGQRQDLPILEQWFSMGIITGITNYSNCIFLFNEQWINVKFKSTTPDLDGID